MAVVNVIKWTGIPPLLHAPPQAVMFACAITQVASWIQRRIRMLPRLTVQTYIWRYNVVCPSKFGIRYVHGLGHT